VGNLSRFAERPFAFFAHYVKMRPVSHALVAAAVLAAVICSVGTQYGVRLLVDALSAAGKEHLDQVWTAFWVLVSLVASDNLLWRLASYIAGYAFIGVTGDLRNDLFRHLTGHSPGYFSDRLPGMLTSRITATSNAVFTIENMFVWNVAPPCVATLGSIALIATVSAPMAAGLAVLAAILVVAMFRLAAAGMPLHHAFADRAAAVDGEMVDVIGNMPLVRAFGGINHEFLRFGATVTREMQARRSSLLYLEKVRLLHALTTVVLTIGLLAWAIGLWQRGAATTGQVVLVCTLGLAILHATRDLAVALVDATQHVARLSEALQTLLVPHELQDHPEAEPLRRGGASVAFENIRFSYPDRRRVFEDFSLKIEPGQRVGLVGRTGCGKSTLFALVQRLYDVQGGRILIEGQDIARVTQESLSGAMAVVPQDISLFHRSILENIRYGRQGASDDEVRAAAVAAHCLGFIEALPEGFDTIVGDRGVKFSGGQRQLIAIARAFLKDAPILLLDEATSALDSESEDAVRAALDDLMRGRTVIAIAHRLSTLRNFDRVVVLRGGRVAQDDRANKLIRREDLYQDLASRQTRRGTSRAA
jgi:ATP-binding cassette, subfamily B, bacterial